MHHHHHHGVTLTRISLTLSRHSSLSSIAPSRSSMLHPVSVQSCCRQVLAGHPTFARPCEELHGSTSLMSLFLLLQQCPGCLVGLIWMDFEMGGRWPYSCCFVGCCLQDLFNIVSSILVQLASSFFSLHLLSVHVVHLYSNINMNAAWKNCVLFYRICLTSI